MARRSSDDYALALMMRERGCTYREIGEHFGCVPSNAYYMVQKGIRNCLTRPSRTVASWDDSGWGHWRAQWGEFNWLGERKKRRDPYGAGEGDLAWQWLYWNDWVATPMIGHNDDNTILAHV